MAVALLQGRIQELAAKIQRCISERGAAETAHCWAWLAIVKVNDGSEIEVMASRLNSRI